MSSPLICKVWFFKFILCAIKFIKQTHPCSTLVALSFIRVHGRDADGLCYDSYSNIWAVTEWTSVAFFRFTLWIQRC